MLRPASVLVFTCLEFSSSVTAAEATGAVTGAISAAQIINLMVGLVLVLLAFFALVFLLKRLSGLQGVNRGHMKIVDALHLGSKERLLIVKVADQHFLLGISAQGIHPLHILGDGIVEGNVQDDNKPRSAFNQILAKFKFNEV